MKHKKLFFVAILSGLVTGTISIAGGGNDGEEDIPPTYVRDDLVVKGRPGNYRKLSADAGVQGLDRADDYELCEKRLQKYVTQRVPYFTFAATQEEDENEVLDRVLRWRMCVGSSESGYTDELSRAFMSSSQPSSVVREWSDKSRIQEIEDLRGIQQNPKWHPEGDAFEHSMLVLDAAAQLTYANEQERRIFLLAAMCHDLGKKAATAFVDGQWRAHGHAARGVRPTLSLLRRFYVEDEIVEPVCELVRFHMLPHNMACEGATVRAYRELAHSFEVITMPMLLKLVLCDLQGVSDTGRPSTKERFDVLEKFEPKAREAGVLE